MKRTQLLFGVVLLLVAWGATGLGTQARTTVEQRSASAHRRDVAYMPTDTSFSQPYGIFVDMRYLTNDPDRVCRLAGDRVPFNFGGAADPTECNTVYPNGNWTQSLSEPNCTITCEQADVIDVPRSQFFNELVAETTTWIAQRIGILPTSPPGVTIVNTTLSCGYFGGSLPVPNYNNSRVTGSAVILMTARPMPLGINSQIYGVATQCQFDQNGRPILGHVNINPRFFPTTIRATKARRVQVRLLARQFIRFMGFADSMFDSWRPRDLDFPDGRSNVIRESSYSSIDRIGNFRLLTPNVVEAARAHFSCSNISSVELENFGGPLVEKAALETRLFRDELLAGQVGHSLVLSPISAALLKDMGWYRVFPSAIEPYLFLRGVGCGAISPGVCPISSINSGYCVTPTDPTEACSFDYRWAARCDFTNNLGVSLPTYYQHFNFDAQSTRTGGASGFADYCPYYNPAVDCTDNLLDLTGEFVDFGTSYSDWSRCFVSRTYNFTAQTTPPTSLPNCFTHACTGNSTGLKVRVGRAWYDCVPGSTIDINVDFNGTIVCPSAERIASVLCSDGSNRVTVWPTIVSVNVTEVSRRGVIGISGSAFIRNMTVYGIGRGFAAELENVTTISDSLIAATIPDVQTLLLDRTPIHLIVTWADDGITRRSAYRRDAVFVLRAYQELTWQERAFQWMFVDNLIFSIVMLCVVGLVLIVVIVIITYRCCKGKCRCCCCK